MKIAIITFHCAHNYGAVLQAYAMQSFLAAAGHDVHVLDYRPDWLVKRYKLIHRPRLGGTCVKKIGLMLLWCFGIPLQIIQLPARMARRRSFERFVADHLKLLSMGEVDRTHQALGALIFGSDQIWNLGITNGFDPTYWGLIGDQNVVRIAYGVSAGGGIQLLDRTDECKKALVRFSRIGVREESVAAYVRAWGLPCDLVVDPTCLIPGAVWDRVATRPSRALPSRYILLYQVKKNNEAGAFAQQMHLKTGLPVIELCTEDVFAYKRNRMFAASPSEFLWYFQHAEFVVSASFHGTVFSIVYRRQFYFFGDGGRGDDRIRQLLDKFGLSSRYLLHASDATGNCSIDYSLIVLSDFASSSICFLEEALAEK